MNLLHLKKILWLQRSDTTIMLHLNFNNSILLKDLILKCYVLSYLLN